CPFRVLKEGVYFGQTPSEHHCGGTAACYAPSPKGVEGDGRGGDEPQELSPVQVPPSRPLREGQVWGLVPRTDGSRDGDVGVLLDGELGDRLTDVTIIMDDLFDGEPHLAKRLAMQGGACGDVRIGRRVGFGPLGRIARRLVAKRRSELRQEDGNPAFRVSLFVVWRRALGDLRPGPVDELVSIVENKSVQRH